MELFSFPGLAAPTPVQSWDGMCVAIFAHWGQTTWDLLRADGPTDLRGLRAQRSGPSLLSDHQGFAWPPTGCKRGSDNETENYDMAWQEKHGVPWGPEQGFSYFTDQKTEDLEERDVPSHRAN